MLLTQLVQLSLRGSYRFYSSFKIHFKSYHLCEAVHFPEQLELFSYLDTNVHAFIYNTGQVIK